MPFDSQQFLQELQAIMQQQRPPRPDSYSAADSAVQIHPYMEGKEPRHAFPTFLDDHQVILFGGGIRILIHRRANSCRPSAAFAMRKSRFRPRKARFSLPTQPPKTWLCVSSTSESTAFSPKSIGQVSRVSTRTAARRVSAATKIRVFLHGVPPRVALFG